MLKAYRSSFVRAMMSTLGVTLALVSLIVGYAMHRSDYNELQKTMQHVLSRINDAGRVTPGSGIPNQRPGQKPGGDKTPKAITPPKGKKEDTTQPLPVDAESLVTMIVDRKTMAVTFVSDPPEDLGADDVDAVVQRVISRTVSYGRLGEFRLIYCRVDKPDNYKIALASTSYIGRRDLGRLSFLSLLYLASMGAFFLLSLRLAHLAAKPMENAMQMERQFVTDVSHDLKTPISVILANNNILRNDPDARVADLTQWIDSTDDAARNMMDLVQKMLTLSSLESVAHPVQLEAVDLSAVAGKCLLQAEGLAFDRSITLQSDVPIHLTAHTSAEYAERICMGLLENALKYEPDGGTVILTLRAEKRQTVLSVCNRGSTIDPQDLPHIFERFYRADKARDLHSGHGLGLSILHKLAELSDAQLEARSSAEEGAEFIVRFPTYAVKTNLL